MPSWDVTLFLPLVRDTVRISDIVEEEDFLRVEDDGQVSLWVEENIERFEVGDRLSIERVSRTFRADVGVFEVEAPGRRRTDPIVFVDLFPSLTSFQGQVTVVPEVELPALRREIQYTGSNFRSVTIQEGTVAVTVQNNLIVPLGPPLRATLKRWDDGSVVAKVSFDQRIEPGASATESVDLSGQTIPDHLIVEIEGRSPGSEGQPVRIDVNSGFTVIADISALKVSEAEARVRSHRFEKDDSVAIEDSILVTEAAIRSGGARLRLTNETPVGVSVRAHLLDLFSSDGEPLTVVFALPAFSSATHRIPLDGYVLRPGLPQDGQQRLRYRVEAITEDTGEQVVHLRSSDGVQADVEIGPLIFSRVTGTLNRQWVDMLPQQIEVDLPDGLDEVDFEEARVQLSILNAIDQPLDLDVNLSGVDEAGRRVNLQVRGTVEPGTPTAPVLTSITLQDEEVVAFLNHVPRRIDITGGVWVGTGEQEAVISEDDFVKGNVTLHAPLSLSFSDQSIEVDPDTVEVEKDVRDQIENHLLHGTIIVHVYNRLPLGGAATIIVRAPDGPHRGPDSLVVRGYFAPGKVDDEGRAWEATLSEVRVELDEQQIELFENPILYVQSVVFLPGTGGIVVRVYGDDFVEVRARGEIGLRVDNDLLGESQ